MSELRVERLQRAMPPLAQAKFNSRRIMPQRWATFSLSLILFYIGGIKLCCLITVRNMPKLGEMAVGGLNLLSI